MSYLHRQSKADRPLGAGADIFTVSRWLASHGSDLSDADLAALVQGNLAESYAGAVGRYAMVIVDSFFKRQLTAA